MSDSEVYLGGEGRAGVSTRHHNYDIITGERFTTRSSSSIPDGWLRRSQSVDPDQRSTHSLDSFDASSFMWSFDGPSPPRPHKPSQQFRFRGWESLTRLPARTVDYRPPPRAQSVAEFGAAAAAPFALSDPDVRLVPLSEMVAESKRRERERRREIRRRRSLVLTPPPRQERFVDEQVFEPVTTQSELHLGDDVYEGERRSDDVYKAERRSDWDMGVRPRSRERELVAREVSSRGVGTPRDLEPLQSARPVDLGELARQAEYQTGFQSSRRQQDRMYEPGNTARREQPEGVRSVASECLPVHESSPALGLSPRERMLRNVERYGGYVQRGAGSECSTARSASAPRPSRDFGGPPDSHRSRVLRPEATAPVPRKNVNLLLMGGNEEPDSRQRKWLYREELEKQRQDLQERRAREEKPALVHAMRGRSGSLNALLLGDTGVLDPRERDAQYRHELSKQVADLQARRGREQRPVPLTPSFFAGESSIAAASPRTRSRVWKMDLDAQVEEARYRPSRDVAQSDHFFDRESVDSRHRMWSNRSVV